MKLVLKSLAAVATFSAILPTAVMAFQAINTLQVNKIDKNTFEVIGRPGAMKDDYWCGAGDYLRRELRLPWKTKIYVVSGIGRGVTTGAKSAVRFTLSLEAHGIEPYEKSWVGDVLTVGYGRSVTAAFHHCDRRIINSFWF